MASTNKCLAQSNKSGARSKATKKREAYRQIEEIVDERAPWVNKKAAIEAEASGGKGGRQGQMAEFRARCSE